MDKITTINLLSVFYIAFLIVNNLLFNNFIMLPIIGEFYLCITVGLMLLPITFFLANIITISSKKFVVICWNGCLITTVLLIILKIINFFDMETPNEIIVDRNSHGIFVDIDYITMIELVICSTLTQFINYKIFNWLSTKYNRILFANTTSNLAGYVVYIITLLFILDANSITGIDKYYIFLLNAFAYMLLAIIVKTFLIYLLLLTITKIRSRR